LGNAVPAKKRKQERHSNGLIRIDPPQFQRNRRNYNLGA
jgi:hypothetical protein